MNRGFDVNTDLSPFANCLFSEGYSFVCRYYNVKNPSKSLTYAEANFLSSVGLNIVVIWEDGRPTSSSYFSYPKGVSDGAAAYEYASATIKQPQLTPIYFAVDYDASETDVADLISDYFRGISDSFKQISGGNPLYFIGVYGSGMVCKTMIETALASYSWLAQSTGWNESKIYKNYNIKQLAEKSECIELGVVTGDPNESPNDKEGSFKVNHLINMLSERGLISSSNLDASVCEDNPTWDVAPLPSKNPLATMEWANNLPKDHFGCTRVDSAGNKKFHGGMDIKASVGTDCYATEDGTITAVGTGSDLGRYVAIKFTKAGNIYGVGYCHLSKHDILKVGDSVTAGTVVGKTGKTGNTGTDATHLHLEVHNGEWKTYDNDVDRSAHSLDPNNYIS